MANVINFFAVTCVLIYFSQAAQIYWADVVNGSEFVLWRPAPVGIELPHRYLFLCRANVDNVWISGKLSIWLDEIRCRVPKDGTEVTHNHYQMLRAALGSVSWVAVNGDIPVNAIVGGIRSNGNNAYICRGDFNGHLIVGSYYEPKCHVTYGLLEHLVDVNIEVLVRNMYGNQTNF